MRGGSRMAVHLFVNLRYLFLYQPCTPGWNVGCKTKGIADATFYDDIWMLLINYMNGFTFPVYKFGPILRNIHEHDSS